MATEALGTNNKVHTEQTLRRKRVEVSVHASLAVEEKVNRHE
jgi:hypothetical protein